LKVSAIIPAAGKGRRFGSSKQKLLALIAGQPLLIHTLGSLSKAFSFSEIIVAAPLGRVGVFQSLLKRHGFGFVKVLAGGKTRAESVHRALEAVSPFCDFVLVHDAARPWVERSLVRRLVAAAKKTGAAISAIPVTSTVKKVDPSKKVILKTVDRALLWLAQTPQVFRKDLLARRYRALGLKAYLATDEAALFDGASTRVVVVEGSPKNIKITTPEDLI
jgi:2-C-methyl-D-erythritol 4-phosphate cytidylyltransferase